MPGWLSYLIAGVIALLIAILLAPYIPAPGSTIVAVIGYIAAAVCLILAIVALVRGGPRL